MRKSRRIYETSKSDFFGVVFWAALIIRQKCNILLFNKLIHLICYLKGVKIGNKVIFNGLPAIQRFPESKIFIGNNCHLNSARNSVFFGLRKPCTFVTLKKDSKIIIGNNVGLSGVILVSASKLEICNNVLIGANCIIIDSDFHHTDPNKRLLGDHGPSRPVLIEDNVFIGANCFILKGVTIGENSVIGINSVVVNSIPKNSIAIGNPCKLVIQKTVSNI
jgi:acetyltransferase-like isoleucine patch superfamily enzyme